MKAKVKYHSFADEAASQRREAPLTLILSSFGDL
jgi:hypothetical protein